MPFDLERIGAGLPFADAVPALLEALRLGAVVVEAPPGTGKTTLVPPVVATTVTGRVILVQPRRVAAHAAARRIAALTGTDVGDLVGVTVRGHRAVGRATRVEVVTPGVLLRRLLSDPELAGVGAVLLDEVHERGLETDLLVALLAEVRQLREDLVVVAMSATLDTQRLSEVLGGAAVVRAEAVAHPLEISWAPAPGPFLGPRGVSREFLEHVTAVTVDAWRAHAEGAGHDALVFLPGAGEVSRVAADLSRRLPGVDVLELHGRLRLDDQARATSGRPPGDRPRVVVTTPVAESSLTVPGVRLVVDSGLSREPRRDAARGMSGLVTVRCSRASAVQRAGRAAREGAGVAVRCYDGQTFAAMAPHVTPEVAVADLTSASLLLAAWGAPSGRGLSLLTPLPEAAAAEARTALTELGALDDDGRITDEGRRLVAVPADPRAARALLEGATRVGARTAAEVVALMEEDLRPEGADLAALLVDLRRGRHPAADRWRRQADRLRDLVDERPSTGGRPVGDTGAGLGDGVGRVVAAARPDRIAHRRGEVYLLASGTRAALPPGSPLRGADWLAVSSVMRAEGRAAAETGAVIGAAASLTEEAALTAGARLVREDDECRVNTGRVVARRVRHLGAIELSSTPTRPVGAAVAEAWRSHVAAAGIESLPWSERAVSLRRRMAFCHHHVGEPWPDVSFRALAADLDAWFDLTVLRVADLDLAAALSALLPWPEAARLDDLAPERLEMADGNRARVDYPEDPTEDGARPVVAVRLQSCFGMTETPRLADGRVPVLFHLLSPARRPLAVTDDLASFWAGPYAQVRAEMRGRYPKHPWPQRP